MALPVINLSTSVLLMQQGAQFAFTPAVTATSSIPVAWYATGLPPGMEIIPETGMIVGVPTTSGVGTIRLRCKNAANEYAAWVMIAYGITPSTLTNIAAVTLEIDLDTGVLWNPQISDPTIPPVFAKTGDRVPALIGFRKNGVLQDVNAVGLTVWLKGENDGQKILGSVDTFQKVGAYNQARYLVVIDFAQSPVRTLIDSLPTVENSPNAPGVHVFPMGEVELTWLMIVNGQNVYGTVTCRSFPIMLSKELG